MIIIGAQKAGTTSLFDYVGQNPNFVASRRKEVHYFDLNYGRSLFGTRSISTQQGMGYRLKLPYYLFHPAVPGRIKRRCRTQSSSSFFATRFREQSPIIMT